MPAKSDTKASSKTPKKRLVLLDSHAIIHRAYHALPEFSNSKGEPTGALYGIATMLMKIITDFKPDYIVACYDLPQKTFRHEAYANYKGTRAKSDPNLIAQIQSSRRIFETFGIPMYDAPGFEADDILGTIVEQLKADKDTQIIIASGDMDTLQLVDKKKVQVFTLKKGINDTVIYDEQAVIERFGFPPKLLPDYKGLRGDTSDNIIGIAGIGEKTGAELVCAFGTIEDLYKKLKKNPDAFKEAGVKPRIVELLKNGEEEALFSKTLATIRRDAPISFELPKQRFLEAVDAQKVEEMFRDLEFRSLIDRVKRVLSGASSASATAEEKAAAKIPVAPEFSDEEKSKADPAEVKKLSIALWLINSDLTSVGYDDIAHYAGSKSYEDGKAKILNDIKEKGLSFVYEEIECPIIPAIEGMEKYGITLDLKKMEKLAVEGHKELSSLEQKIWAHAGREFNLNSPKQLGEVLFDEMKVQEGSGKKMKKTDAGARSTRESELLKLQGLHPIIDEILAYRELSKLVFTYIDALPSLVAADGRVHSTFSQAGTTTGRFSSNNPNLQNIPVKNALAKEIREAFVAPKGHVFLAFDYSQIELRIAAVLARDEFLLKTFEEGRDIHAAVASRVFGVPEAEVTGEMRRRAKVINFGILYGMGVSALKENLGTDRKEAQEFYDNYFASFPKIAGYMDGVTEFAKKNGYTVTLFGRRRNLSGLRSPLPYLRAAAERQAGNAPVQGTGADVMKIAIRDAYAALQKAGLLDKAHLVLQVHDEIIYEVEEGVREQVSKIVQKAMLEVLRPEYLKDYPSVPLEVHVHEGSNWGELK